MNELKAVTYSIIFILISNGLGLFSGIFSILLTPIIIGIATWIILFKCNWNLYWKALMLVFFILINDVLIRLTSGGNHDSDGNGWILLFFYFGTAIYLTFLFAYGIQIKRKIETILILSLSISLIYIYISQNRTLGLTWKQSAFDSCSQSKEFNVFTARLNYNDSILISNQDTFKITDGWIEKEIEIDNSRFKKKYNPTGSFNVILTIEGPFDKYGHSDKVYYQINDSTEKRGSAITEKIVLNSSVYTDSIIIYFYQEYFKAKIKEFKINLKDNK